MSKQPSIGEMAEKYWLSLRWGDVKERTLDGVVKDAFLAGAAAQRKLDEKAAEMLVEALDAIADFRNPDASSRQYWKDSDIDSLLTIFVYQIKAAREAIRKYRSRDDGNG